MASMIRKHEGQAPSAAVEPFRTFWSDPIRAMRELFGVDPLALPFVSGGLAGRESMFVPDIDIRETKDAFVLCADLPGVKEDEIDISVIGNRVTISGKREQEREREGERFYAYERSFGTFHRSLALPEGADTERVSAELKNGVLRVEVPKKPEVKAKRISIGGGPGKPEERAEAAEGKAQKPEAARKGGAAEPPRPEARS